jgi:glycosyltransferase involved in cell wall biosynthesis
VALDPAQAGERPMTSRETVSMVMPVYNGERHLEAALTSLLAQTEPPAEIIVVDDGSTDASAQVAARFGAPVRVVPTAHAGIAPARNVGVRATRGEIVGFLDADDLWTPEALHHLRARLSADPGLDVVFGHVRQFLSPELEPAEAMRLFVPDGLEPGYLVGGGLIRRRALERVGPFREDVQTGEFIDWMARARELDLSESLVEDQVLWRRVHGSNHGRSHSARTDYARILKAALDRRRTSSSRASGGG